MTDPSKIYKFQEFNGDYYDNLYKYYFTDSCPVNNMKITFGKYNSKEFKWVFDNDKKYCIWCIETVAINASNKKTINFNMIAFVEFCKQMFERGL
jgi:hypothetical protein